MPKLFDLLCETLSAARILLLQCPFSHYLEGLQVIRRTMCAGVFTGIATLMMVSSRQAFIWHESSFFQDRTLFAETLDIAVTAAILKGARKSWEMLQ